MSVTRGFLVSAFVLIWIPTFAIAGYSPDTQELFERHKNWEVFGFGFEDLPVLHTVAGRGRDDAIDRLLPIVNSVAGLPASKPGYKPAEVRAARAAILHQRAAMPASTSYNFRSESSTGDVRIIESEDSTTLLGEAFRLRVFNDGDAYTLINRNAAHDVRGNQECRFSDSELKEMALKHIADLGVIAKDEFPQLYHLKTRFIHFTGNARDPGDRIVGAVVVLGRKVEGIPVIGIKSSAIRMEINARNEVVSLVVDWAHVRAGMARNRIAKPVSFNARLAGMAKQRILENAIAPADTELEITISTMICGYFDPGARRFNAETFEPGCFVNYGLDGEDEGIIAVIPMLEGIYADSWWPDASNIEYLEALGADPTLPFSVRVVN